MITTEQLEAGLGLPASAIAYHLMRVLQAQRPGKALVHAAGEFELENFVGAKACAAAPLEGVLNLESLWLDDDRVMSAFDHAACAVTWQGHALEVLVAEVTDDGCTTRHTWIVADQLEVAEGFFRAVMQWDRLKGSSLVVFDEGQFHKRDKLVESIRATRLDDLVLADDLERELLDDVRRFCSARELYRRHRIPWKRGLLLVGPPGNGKTHLIRGLINELGLPCIYVRTFKARHYEEPSCIRRVFERAREVAPCLLVMEDLDALVSPEHRSALLNELDGFAANEGILTLATTNHPELLDRAILDRPSRFDRKFTFNLPALPERLAYLTRWSDGVEPELRVDAASLAALAEATRGFTFAYLKELTLGAMMAWMSDPRPGSMGEVLARVASTLRREMSAANDALGPLPGVRKIGLVADAD